MKTFYLNYYYYFLIYLIDFVLIIIINFGEVLYTYNNKKDQTKNLFIK